MIRRTSAIAAVALACLTLAGCAKPNPGVSVVTGLGGAQHQEALCWGADGQVSAQTCAADILTGAIEGGSVPTAGLVPGATVGISVDPVVAETGWVPSINGQALVTAPLHQEYYRFQYPSLQAVPAEGLYLDVRALSGDLTRGFWVFKLTPAE